MPRSHFQSLCVLLLTLLFITVSSQAMPVDNIANLLNTTQQNTITNPQKPIIIQPGSPNFSIYLPANPSTGYQWYLANYNPRLIKLVGSHYEKSPHPEAIGSAGISTWNFVMQETAFVAPHTTVITLVYRRPWETTVDKQQDFIISSQAINN